MKDLSIRKITPVAVRIAAVLVVAALIAAIFTPAVFSFALALVCDSAARVQQLLSKTDEGSSLSKDIERSPLSEDEREQLAQFNDENRSFSFSFRLFKAIASENPAGNLIVSPFGVRAAFRAIYPGARGVSKEKLRDVFGFSDSVERTLAEGGVEALLQKASNGALEFSSASGAWLERSLILVPEFAAHLRRQLESPVTLADFRTDAAGSVKAINAWIAERTRGHIQHLLSANAVNPRTFLIIANGTYFYSPWLFPFSKASTVPAEFHGVDGAVTVSMMNLHLDELRMGRHATSSGTWAVAALSYLQDFEFVWLLPPQSDFVQAVSEIEPEPLLKSLTAMMPASDVDVSMPRFSIKTEGALKLSRPLQSLGLERVFCEPNPLLTDFSGMLADSREPVCVSGALHSAMVDVNEEGSRAAAATAVDMGTLRSLRLPETFRVDRPAVFFIWHRPSRIPIFIGQLTLPESARP